MPAWQMDTCWQHIPCYWILIYVEILIPLLFTVEFHASLAFGFIRPTASNYYLLLLTWPSVLWRCWLGVRKGIRPVKTEWWGAGVVICLERGADLHTDQLMQLPLTVSCFSKIQIGFTFLVTAHLGSPGQRAVKWVLLLLYVMLYPQNGDLIVTTDSVTSLHPVV